MTRVVLLSDFGNADGYAAAMAAVVATEAPDAVIDHATHEIAPGDVFGGALSLSRYALRYPRGTVHLAVVDPGVGTDRRALAAELDGRLFVAPDNGLIGLVATQATTGRFVRLAVDRAASATFHGRDVFAPAAGRLAAGAALSELGEEVTDPRLLPIPDPVRGAEGVAGVVVHIDRFGSLVTNVPARLVTDGMVWVGYTAVGPARRTYDDVAGGELVALVGSLGLLEISVNGGSAADRLVAGRGAPVFVDAVSSRASPDRRRKGGSGAGPGNGR